MSQQHVILFPTKSDNTTMDDKSLLDPPGAGLPAMELVLSRLVFRVLRSTLTRNQIQEWLCSETKRVLTIVRGLSLEQMRRQVLVQRLVGLEDNSRNWSAAMVMQHLIIVENKIGELLVALCEDKSFGCEIRIADVKPTPDAGQEQLACLEQALTAYLDRVAETKNLHSVRRHAHPWFGPLDGHGWHAMTALHTMIHRRQLEAIVQALKE